MSGVWFWRESGSALEPKLPANAGGEKCLHFWRAFEGNEKRWLAFRSTYTHVTDFPDKAIWSKEGVVAYDIFAKLPMRYAPSHVP